MMYFLDTNALYWYYGRDKLNMTSKDNVDEEKFSHFLDSTTQKTLATSAFIEAVVHFRNEPDLLKRLLRFIQEKKLRLYNNVPHYSLNNDEFSIVLRSNETVLKSYSGKILEEKIKIETQFATIFLYIMSMLYLHHRLSEEQIPDNVKSALIEYIGKIPLSNEETRIHAELTDGYLNNVEEKRLKEIYIELLEERYLIVNYFVGIALEYEDESVNLVDVIQNIYEGYKNDKTRYNFTSKQRNFLMERIKNELMMNSTFLSTAKPKIANMFSEYKTKDNKRLFIELQSRYIEEIMFDAWIDRGKKIEKNDIFDMLFIGCFSYIEKPQNVLEDPNTYLLSFDKTVKRFIGKNKGINGTKIDSFYITS